MKRITESHRDYRNMSQDDIRRLIDESHIYEIELELQNEELRDAQLRLDVSLKKYTDLYDFAPVAYLTICDKGHILEANLAASTLLAKERSKLVNSQLTKFITDEDQDTFYLYRKNVTGGTMAKSPCELQMQTSDGSRFYASLNCIPVADCDNRPSHLRIAITNSTERRQATARVEEARKSTVEEQTRELRAVNRKLLQEIAEHERADQKIKLFCHLIDQSNDAIITADPDTGRLIDFNQCACRMLGYSKQELAALTIHDIHTKLPKQSYETDDIENAEKHGSTFLKTNYKRKDGTVCPVELSSRHVSISTGEYVIEIARDTTQFQKLHDQRNRAERLAVLGEFSASVAHEIRNPLAAIELRLSNLAAALHITPEDNGDYDHILTAIENAKHIIDEILNFAKPAPPDFRNAQITTIIDGNLGMLAARLRDCNVSVVRNYMPQTRPVYVDYSHFMQIFSNIIFNALAAMPDGGNLSITTKERKQFLLVEINDTGTGIGEDGKELIFDPFYTTKPDGTGLGLAIVSRLLEANHSTIKVESMVEKGTTFTISIPFADVQ